MAGPIILMYNLDSRTSSRLKVLCQKQHLRWREVEASEYGLAIGALAGIPTARAAEDTPEGSFQEPMLVMCNLLNTQLNAFLQGMRDMGVPRISLKAILTPSNVCWNAIQLRDELAQEHEAVQKRIKASKTDS